MRAFLTRHRQTLWILAAFAALSGVAAICAPLADASPAALPGDPVMDSAQLCMQHFGHSEIDNGIPKQLLSAIAMTESGRWSDGAGAVVPWPWTINTGGQGYYFDSMHEAVVFAKRQHDKGNDNMDVGCMQINMHHHPEAFANLIDAFDPEKNVAYGAKFLRSQFDDLKSWPEAIAAYHSRTPEYGHPYYANVRRNWQRVLHGGNYAMADASFTTVGRHSRVRGVEVTRGMSPPTARPANSTFQISVSDEKGFRSIDENRRGRRIETKMPAAMPERGDSASTRSARVIRIGEGSTRAIASMGAPAKAPEVLIVRPVDKTSQVKALAVARTGKTNGNVSLAMSAPGEIPAESFVIARGGKSSRTASADTQMTSTGGAEIKRISSTRRAGPNFIFD